MKNYTKLPLYLFAALGFAFASCESEDPVEENDGEVITDVTLTFQEMDESNNPVGSPFSFTASDPQGIEVGGSPTIETVTLTRGKTYLMTIEVYNSIEDEDITEEIEEEADEHQFYFLGSGFDSNILSISYADPDGIALGLRNMLTVSSSPGTNNTQMRVVLRHDLDKNSPGADDPNFANFVQAGGESDLDITFPVVIN
ncbi:hypothetical protein [Algoriphagus confluentis]|uniref:Type 1 periplasmic binding fold superfamily protein n=1 Tax=Algoriphagus confluentis TaxID=1697556 RepID=A0ABQ6PIQ3_9BACT|nr:hypothetical protein Aconfl_02150 [Algoriphagus confluentis]